MKVTGTKLKLLVAAEQLFAEQGYEAASVRSITALAGVDLGAVRYHFGSKLGLFQAVVHRRLTPLNQQRLANLERLENAAKPAVPSVEALLRAFAQPAFTLMLDPEVGGYWVKLLARLRVDGPRFLLPTLPELNEVVQRYVTVLGKQLPHVPAEELACRWFFYFGAQIITLQDRHSLPALSGMQGLKTDPEAVLSRLIAFSAAGLRAPL